MRARRAVERARGIVDEGGGGCYEKDSWTEEWQVIGLWRNGMEFVDAWTISSARDYCCMGRVG